MNIFIIALGTRGDVQPYVALALGLKKAGHQVTICSTENFRSFVTEYGLPFEPTRDDILEIMNTEGGRALLQGDLSFWKAIETAREMLDLAGPLQKQMLDDTWRAAERTQPDLILCHPKGYGGPHIAEKLGIPIIMALVIPGVVPTAAFPGFGFPEWKLGGWYNRWTAQLFTSVWTMSFAKPVKSWRNTHGLPPVRGSLSLTKHPNGSPIPAMHGFSEHVVPFPSDWPDYATMTGYWFLDQPDTWQPPAPLIDFLNASKPPVYIGFGSSISGTKTARISQVVVEAVRKANVRAILAKGWGGLDARDLPESIYQIDGAPHDWLFPRMAAVVHHGGAGTTAAGLYAGKPSLICPFSVDQPFWGHRVHALGAGPVPIPSKALTVDKLARALRDLVDNAHYRERSEAIGDKLRKEDSIAAAIAFIERHVELQTRG